MQPSKSNHAQTRDPFTAPAGKRVLRWRSSERVAPQGTSSAFADSERNDSPEIMRVVYQAPAAQDDNPVTADDLFGAPPARISDTPEKTPGAAELFGDPFNDKGNSEPALTLPPSLPPAIRPIESQPTEEPSPVNPQAPFEAPAPFQVPDTNPNDLSPPMPAETETPQLPDALSPLRPQADPTPQLPDALSPLQPQSEQTPPGIEESTDPNRFRVDLDGNSKEDKNEGDAKTNPFRDDRSSSEDSASDREPDGFDFNLDPPPESRRPDFNPKRPKTNISCDKLRESVTNRPISNISLDISPAFRPGELDDEKYAKLQQEFADEQQPRDWRSIDGSLITNGTLRDLSYQQVIIETVSGGVERIPASKLSEADLAHISKAWGLPRECRIAQVSYAPRNWMPMKMSWKASNLCHNPLYFEELQLERYGHSAGPFKQPVISTAHFFFNIAVMPYKMGIHPPSECQYALGYYRPGSCAPYLLPPIPISLRGAISEAAVIASGFAIIP